MASITRRNQPNRYAWKAFTDAGVTIMASKHRRHKRRANVITKDGRGWSIGKREKPISAGLLRRQGKRMAQEVERGCQD